MSILWSRIFLSVKAVIQEQQLARERNLETAGSDMQRRYHISDDAHPLQAGLDAAAGIADQVELISFLLVLPLFLYLLTNFGTFFCMLFRENRYYLRRMNTTMKNLMIIMMTGTNLMMNTMIIGMMLQRAMNRFD